MAGIVPALPCTLLYNITTIFDDRSLAKTNCLNIRLYLQSVQKPGRSPPERMAQATTMTITMMDCSNTSTLVQTYDNNTGSMHRIRQQIDLQEWVQLQQQDMR